MATRGGADLPSPFFHRQPVGPDFARSPRRAKDQGIVDFLNVAALERSANFVLFGVLNRALGIFSDSAVERAIEIVMPKTAKVLTQCENLDKALYDWRKINNLFASPTPVVECTSEGDAKSIATAIEAAKWNVGKLLVVK